MNRRALVPILWCSLGLTGASCNRNAPRDAGSAPKFFSENIRSYGFGVYDLTLTPKAIVRDTAPERRGVVFGRRSTYRLAFYRVVYERNTPGSEGAVVETRYVGDMQIPEQKFLAHKIPISTQRSGGTLEDGAYVAVVCENLAKCVAPATTTLTAYKAQIQSGACGNANNSATGAFDEKCAKILLAESPAEASAASPIHFLAVAYPLTVRGGKFVTGDDHLYYVQNEMPNLSLASESGTRQARPSFALAEAVCSDRLAALKDSLGGFNARMLDTDLCPTDTDAAGGRGVAPERLSEAMAHFNGTSSSIVDGTSAEVPHGGLSAEEGPGTILTEGGRAGGRRLRITPIGFGEGDCFLEGTTLAVATTTGGALRVTEKRVEEIRVGDFIYNPLLRKAYPVEVTHKDEKSGETFYEIATSQTPPLRVTSVHPIVTPEGYTSAELLYKRWAQRLKTYVLATRNLPVKDRADLVWAEVTEMKPIRSLSSYFVYNIETKSDRSILFPGDNSWVFPMTTVSGNQCEEPSCSEFYVSSNRLVTGDLARQKILQAIVQQSMNGMNALFARTYNTVAPDPK